MLKKVLGPFLNTFFQEYWNKKLLHIANETTYWKSMFTLEEFHQIIYQSPLTIEDITLRKASHSIEEISLLDGRYSYFPKTIAHYEKGRIDRSVLLLALKNQEQSIKICSIDRFSIGIQIFASQLMKQLNSFVSINCYYTPANGTCLPIHSDSFDIFTK